MDLKNLRPFIRNKHLLILALLGFIAILVPSYLGKSDWWAAYTLMGLIALITFGLYTDVRFQKLHKTLRPFIVTRIVQVFTGITSILAFAHTFPLMLEKSAYVPYGIFWLLVLTVNYQLYSIFHMAKVAKKNFPDRCEFC